MRLEQGISPTKKKLNFGLLLLLGRAENTPDRRVASLREGVYWLAIVPPEELLGIEQLECRAM